MAQNCIIFDNINIFWDKSASSLRLASTCMRKTKKETCMDDHDEREREREREMFETRTN